MTSFSRMATGLYLKKIEIIKMFFKRFDIYVLPLWLKHIRTLTPLMTPRYRYKWMDFQKGKPTI